MVCKSCAVYRAARIVPRGAVRCGVRMVLRMRTVPARPLPCTGDRDRARSPLRARHCWIDENRPSSRWHRRPGRSTQQWLLVAAPVGPRPTNACHCWMGCVCLPRREEQLRPATCCVPAGGMALAARRTRTHITSRHGAVRSRVACRARDSPPPGSASGCRRCPCPHTHTHTHHVAGACPDRDLGARVGSSTARTPGSGPCRLPGSSGGPHRLVRLCTTHSHAHSPSSARIGAQASRSSERHLHCHSGRRQRGRNARVGGRQHRA